MSTQDIVLYFTLASSAINLVLDVFHNVRSGHFQSSCCGKNMCSLNAEVEKEEEIVDSSLTKLEK